MATAMINNSTKSLNSLSQRVSQPLPNKNLKERILSCLQKHNKLTFIPKKKGRRVANLLSLSLRILLRQEALLVQLKMY